MEKPYQLAVGTLHEGRISYLTVDVLWSSGKRTRLDLDSSVFERQGKSPRGNSIDSIEGIPLENWVESMFFNEDDFRDYFYVVGLTSSNRLLTHRPSAEERAEIIETDLRLSPMSDREWEDYLDEQEKQGP